MKEKNRNLYLLKLLTASDEFQTDIVQIRKESSIPPKGFLNNEELIKWYEKLYQDTEDFWESEDYKKRRKKLLLLRKKDCAKFIIEEEHLNNEAPINKFNNSVEKIVGKYNLPYNFLDVIRAYIYHNKIIPLYLPYSNFAISYSLNEDGRAKWVDLRTYSRLTEKEIRKAIKNLRATQEYCLPPALNINIKIRKDIDMVLEIEKEMRNTDRRRKEGKADSYLVKVRKQYGEKVYRKTIRKQQAEGIKSIKRKINKHKSREIAKKIFGTSEKENLVRQIYSRLQKERKKLFEI